MLHLVATCAPGLEEFLEQELLGLGAEGIRRQQGAVSFTGTWSDVWRCNWRLRTANRVLVELGRWDARGNEELAQGAQRLVKSSTSWEGVAAHELLHPRRSFAIRATSRASRLTDSRWIGVRVKDGLADGQRERFGRRGTVRRKDPELPLRVWLFRDRATLLLDTSGSSLSHRGYRVSSTNAPVREQLAAACVLASEWDGQGPILDPMCGSGTLLVEAASWALGWAPGRLRESWVFERFPGFRPDAWTAIRREPLPARTRDARLLGVDRSSDAIQAARANIEAAGLGAVATLETGDAFTFSPPPGPGLLVVNPAYGERLEAAREQWPRLGDLMKQRYRGWRAVVLAGGPGLGKHIGLRPRRRYPVRNGPLDARILVFDLY